MKDSKLLKGTLQTIILKLLADTEQMYGYEMTKLKKVVERVDDTELQTRYS